MPLLLSPALPAELLTHILEYHVYPTTLIICSTRSVFMSALQDDTRKQDTLQLNKSEDVTTQSLIQETQESPPGQEDENIHTRHSLLSQTLSQLAISRHIRIVYIPTVTHLRAYMSLFVPEDTKVVAPPASFVPPARKPPTLIVYGVIEMHRDTSEWSAQGLGNTMAVLVEAASRLGWGLVVVEPHAKPTTPAPPDEDSHQEGETGRNDGLQGLLQEKLPILSGSTRRGGLDLDEGGWSSRSVEVGRVMSRWFTFQRGNWDTDDYGDMEDAK